MNKMSTELIAKFTCDWRKETRSPWNKADLIRATNGHIAIELPKKLAEKQEYKFNKEAPDFNNVYKQIDEEGREVIDFDKAALDKVLDDKTVEYYQEWGCLDCACDKCKEGRAVKPQGVSYLGRSFDVRYLLLISEVVELFGGSDWKINTGKDPLTTTFFLKDNIRVALMPRRD